MDLNYLLARHQVSIMRADAAACVASRASHAAMADAYARQIRGIQLESGATAQLG